MVIQASLTQSQQLDATFAALADPTRRAILARLALGDASVAELAKPFAMSQPAISKHLKVLEHAGLVSAAHEAQRRPRKLEAARLGEATAWLEKYREFWERRYSALDELLDELQAMPSKASSKTKSKAQLKVTSAATSKPKRKRS